MFKSENIGVAWAHRTLKHIKVYIKIVKQHASKPLLEAQRSLVFCCSFNKKIRGDGGTENPQKSAILTTADPIAKSCPSHPDTPPPPAQAVPDRTLRQE